MNEWKDEQGVWQPPDGIHFMRSDPTPPYEAHTYRKDGEVVSHTDCWCTNK